MNSVKAGLLAMIICSAFGKWLGLTSDFSQISLMLASVSMLGFLSVWDRKDFYLNWVDVTFFLSIPYVLLRTSLAESGFCIKGLIVIYALAYFCSRNIKCSDTVVLSLFAVTGTVEALYGILSYYYWAGDNPFLSYPCGSFNNSGPYGCYLALTLIATAVWARKSADSRFKHALVLTGLALQLWAVILSGSRASWVAITAAALYYLIHRIADIKRFVVILSITLFTGFVAGMYFLRPQSADARLFIWKVSMAMISESPIVGLGTGAFASNYMLYQAETLQNKPDGDWSQQAANNTYAFNDYLSVGVEHGIIGLILFALPIILTLCYGKQRTGNCFRIMLMAYAVFALFSYPMRILQLFVCLPLLIGLSQPCRQGIRICPDKKLVFLMVGLLCGLLCIWNFRNYTFCSQVRHDIQSLYTNRDKLAAKRLKTIYPCFKYEKELVLSYGKVLELQHADRRIVLERCVLLNPTTETLCALGKCYQEEGEFRLAEQSYERAISMVPNLVVPYFYLFKLYGEEGKEQDAIRIANSILSMRPKVVNSVVLDIKRKVRTFLNCLDETCRETDKPCKGCD